MKKMLFAAALCLPTFTVASDDSKDEASKKAIELSITEFRDRLQKHDFDILASEYGLQSTEHDYYQSLGAFDVTFGHGWTEQHDRSLTSLTGTLFAAGREHNDTITRTSTTSLSKLWSTGLTTSLGYTGSHGKTKRSLTSSHPARTSQWSLSFNQPLLKNFGTKSAMSSVYSARETLSSSRQDHARLRLTRLLTLEQSYWQWILDRETEAVRDRSVKRATDVLDYNQSAFEAGTFARTEVLEAETRLLESQANELSAQQNTLDSADQLRLLVGWEQLQGSFFSNEALPVLTVVNMAKEDVLVGRALTARQDVLSLQHSIRALQHSLDKSKRDRLPDLDLDLSVDWDGAARNHGNSFDKSLSSGDWDWTVGLDFSFPLGNRSARNSYLSSKYGKMRTEKQLAELRAQVVLEIRQNRRAVVTQLKIVETRRKALESATATLNAETQKHRLGRISTLTLAQVQERSDDAELALLQARRDVWIALVTLRVSVGGEPDSTVEAP